MEPFEIMLILSIITVPTTIFLLTNRGSRRTKKAAMSGDMAEILHSKDLTIKEQRSELNRQLGRVNRYKQLLTQYEEGSEEDEKEQSLPWEELTKIASNNGINPIMLEPFKDTIQDALKDKSISEIEQLVKTYKPLLGNLKSKQQNETVGEFESITKEYPDADPRNFA